MPGEMVLEVNNLTTRFTTPYGVVKAVNGVSFSVKAGQTLGIVGESGCGKSVTALSLLGLIEPPGKITGGEVLLNGYDVLKLSGEQLRRVRGSEISMVFQDPMTSLNPVLTVGRQVTESILAHQSISKEKAYQRALELLAKVGLPHPEKFYRRYPFQLSGGQRQRVMIAMALSLTPKVLIADEPTTALDVTVQAQILGELTRLKKEFNTGIVLITHDLGVIAETADDVAVMYAGSIVEYGPVLDIFENPGHPYTRALLHSVPRLGGGGETLEPIRGQPPDPLDLPGYCAFAPRCPQVSRKCREGLPTLKTISPGHLAACHYAANSRTAKVMPT
jgi:oligopeptide/dipeptide ABC transporter ATP-binding protein